MSLWALRFVKGKVDQEPLEIRPSAGHDHTIAEGRCRPLSLVDAPEAANLRAGGRLAMMCRARATIISRPPVLSSSRAIVAMSAINRTVAVARWSTHVSGRGDVARSRPFDVIRPASTRNGLHLTAGIGRKPTPRKVPASILTRRFKYCASFVPG